jgi:D-arginine dehydrogenase
VDDAGIYIRPHTGGWLCCPCDEQLRWPEPGPGSRGEANPGAEAWIRARLSRFFPDLGGVDFAERWTGLRTFAPDRRPVLGEDPEIEGLWWVAGLGGSGVTWSAAVGEAVATWMGGGTTSWLRPEDVSPARIHMNRWWTRPDGDRARLTPVSRYPGAGVDLVDAPAG